MPSSRSAHPARTHALCLLAEPGSSDHSGTARNVCTPPGCSPALRRRCSFSSVSPSRRVTSCAPPTGQRAKGGAGGEPRHSQTRSQGSHQTRRRHWAGQGCPWGALSGEPAASLAGCTGTAPGACRATDRGQQHRGVPGAHQGCAGALTRASWARSSRAWWCVSSSSCSMRCTRSWDSPSHSPPSPLLPLPLPLLPVPAPHPPAPTCPLPCLTARPAPAPCPCRELLPGWPAFSGCAWALPLLLLLLLPQVFWFQSLRKVPCRLPGELPRGFRELDMGASQREGERERGRGEGEGERERERGGEREGEEGPSRLRERANASSEAPSERLPLMASLPLPRPRLSAGKGRPYNLNALIRT